VSLLEVEGLSAGYGRIRVLHDLTMSLQRGSVTGVFGHNGMGKTTLLRALMGFLPALAGSVRFAGQDITRLPPFERARLGLGFLPQGRQILPDLSVRENLRAGALLAASTRREEAALIEEVLADFPRLAALLDRLGSTLSGGEQQILALARCLCGRPRLMLLDEPSEGVQPSLVADIAQQLATLKQRSGTAILLVEQNLTLLTSLSQRVLVLRRGRIVQELAPADIEDAAAFGATGPD